MNKFFLLLISFFVCKHINGEEPFKVNGKIESTDTDTLMFKYYRCEKDSTIIDTISVTNRAFTIEGIISPRSYAQLFINDNEVDFFIDPGEMQLYLKKDSLESFVLKGSKTQEDKEMLEVQTKPLEEYLSKIKTQLSSEQNEQNKDILINQKSSINNLLENIWINFITSHPVSYYSIDVIYKLLVNKKQNGNVLMSLFDSLSEDVRESCSGKYMHSYILQRKKSTMTNVSSLEALDKDGNLIKISNFEGKFILVDFWASWCVPCIKGLPHLKELYAKYKDKGLVVIGISIDKEEDEQRWLTAVERNNITEWIHILSCKNKGEDNICDLHDNLAGSSIPHYTLIDKTGNVIKQWRGFDDTVAKEQNEMFEKIFENKK